MSLGASFFESLRSVVFPRWGRADPAKDGCIPQCTSIQQHLHSQMPTSHNHDDDDDEDDAASEGENSDSAPSSPSPTARHLLAHPSASAIRALHDLSASQQATVHALIRGWRERDRKGVNAESDVDDGDPTVPSSSKPLRDTVNSQDLLPSPSPNSTMQEPSDSDSEVGEEHVEPQPDDQEEGDSEDDDTSDDSSSCDTANDTSHQELDLATDDKSELPQHPGNYGRNEQEAVVKAKNAGRNDYRKEGSGE